MPLRKGYIFIIFIIFLRSFGFPGIAANPLSGNPLLSSEGAKELDGLFRSFEVSLMVENMCLEGDLGRIRFDVSKLEPPRNLSARVRKEGEPFEQERSISQGQNEVSNYLTYKGSSNFPPGNYIIEVSRQQGGVREFRVTIGPPAEPLSATVTQEWDVCPVNHATAHPVGGYGGYTFLWNDPNRSTTQTVSGLRPGNYSVTITDSNGCKVTVSNVNIPDSDAIFLDREIIHPSCGQTDGQVRITDSNLGFGRHEVVWRKDDPHTGEIISGDKNGAENLTEGTYYLIIKEIVNGNCEEFPFEFILTERGTPVSLESDELLICEGDTAEMIASVEESYGEVEYRWYRDANKTNRIIDNSAMELEAGSNQIIYAIGENGRLEILGLSASEEPYEYYVEAIGENVCGSREGELKSVYVTVNPKPQPPIVIIIGGYLRN
jgi:hypothetical protein